MSSVIKSGSSTDELTVDPVSKAARVTLYDPSGVALDTAKAVYSLPVNLPIFAALAANSAVWMMKNGGTKTIKIKELLLTLGFTGVAAATMAAFEIVRVSGSTPSGGTPAVLGSGISKNLSTNIDSTLADSRQNGAAALVTTGVIFDTIGVALVGLSRSVTGKTQEYVLHPEITLLPNEGLAIRSNVANVVGDAILGTISWSEE
jgi:hypothetical protein